MVKSQLNLTYALKDGIITSISNVESGLKCGCVCPACDMPLVAKKGEKMMHHFAHHAGHNCEYGYESSLHLAAKDILSKAKKIVIPPVYVKFPDSYKKDELVCEEREINIDRVELEKRYNDIIPDIVIYAGGRQFFVEIFVTHCIDDVKLEKLKKANISTIEIDLSKKNETITTEELTELLLSNSNEKKWKYNVIAQSYLQKIYKVSDKRKLVSRGFAVHVDNCPIKSRVWKGKPYANFLDDCLYCEYCILSKKDDEMLCSGRLRIASIADFDIPENQRIRESDKGFDDLKENAFIEGICPNCGGKLVERQSRYGTFWGCSNYPHCRFTASPDPQTGEIKMKA